MKRSMQLMLTSVATLLVACQPGNDSGGDSADTKSLERKSTKSEAVYSEPVPIRLLPDAELEEVSVSAMVMHADMPMLAAPHMARQKKSASARMRSFQAGPKMDISSIDDLSGEKYQAQEFNPIKQASVEPVSTFSVDVDTAAYSNVRRYINQYGQLPPADAVRLEEMINYFQYNYPSPKDSNEPFRVTTELTPSPWAEGKHLLSVALKAYEPEMTQRPQANLVFLVDVSGSMQARNKLPLLKKSLGLLVNQMQENDRIALVAYAGAAGVVLKPTMAKHAAEIKSAIDKLEAGGSTNGGEGLKLAYQLAEQNHVKGGINRVIIASDGDMNVGIVDPRALKQLVIDKRKSGVALTTLGFGEGNYNDGLMEQLADVGNGNAAYIDSLKEAQKVLVDEMQSTLLTVARDVKLQVEFNPQRVSEYRLLGYENRMLAREDFKNDKVDAAEMGAGHTVTALYEISLVGSKSNQLDPLRYKESKKTMAAMSDELAFIKWRYKKQLDDSSVEGSKPVLMSSLGQGLDEASDNLRFAAAVASFGELLRGGKYSHNWGYGDVLSLAKSARGQDAYGYRAEFIGLVGLANSLSGARINDAEPAVEKLGLVQ